MTNDSIPAPRNDASVFEGSVAGDAAASVAVAAFNVALYTAIRYAPEYLRLLGNGPVVIGLFGSTATLLAVVYPHLGSEVDRLGSSAAPVVGTLASLGVVCWLVAPQLGPTDGVRSVALVLAGLALIESWQAIGPETAATIGVVPQRIRDRVPQVIRHARTPRYVALLAGLPIVVGFLAMISPAITAIQVVLGLAAAIGVTTTVLLVVLDEDETPAAGVDSASGHGRSDDATDGETAEDGWIATSDEPIRSALDSLRSLPRSVRQPLVGDALVEFAVGMVSVFLVITVTSVLEIDVTLFGQRLRPDAFFGVCLVAEMSVALLATGPLTRLANRIGRERVVAGTLLVAALFPIALVSAPANATVVTALFAVFGLYRAGLPTRHAFVDTITTETDATTEGDTTTSDDAADARGRYRAVRAALRVPSGLVGGVLYAVSPTLAFGLATVVGAVGVRELLVGTTRLGGDATHAG